MDIKVTTNEQVICVSHKDGINGKSAYQQAVEGGYTGTEQEFDLTLNILADIKQVKKNLIQARFLGCTALREARFPNSTQWGVYEFSDTNNLEILEFGVLSYNSGKAYSLYEGNKNKLRNFIVGANSDANLELKEWRAKDVINEGQSGIDELNSNLYNNLLTKLYDHSTDGQTRTLRLGWLAHVTQENIDYANSKGWTLTT